MDKTVSRKPFGDHNIVIIEFQAIGESLRCMGGVNKNFSAFISCQFVVNFLQNGLNLGMLNFFVGQKSPKIQKCHRNQNLTKKIIEYGDRS